MPISDLKCAGVRNRTNEVRIFGHMWLKLILTVAVLLICSNVALARESSSDFSCRSKEERHLYHTSFREEPSKAFVEKLREYEKMHKRCMQENVWKRSFFENSTDNTDASLPQCRYVVFEGSLGFGNRIHGLISAFLYALLTNRTLIAGATSDSQLLCTPFPESTWVLKEEVLVMTGFGKSVHVPLVVEEALPRHKAYFVLRYDAPEENLFFFCDEAQPALRDIPWLMLNQGRYFGPHFAGMKSFRKDIERWFPTRVVYTHLARYLLHPKDKYWDRITNYYNAHLRGAQKRIGLQVRTFSHDDSWANEKVLECAVNVSHYLPHPKQIMEQNATTKSQSPISDNATVSPTTAVFVASLHGGHLKFLNATYQDGFAADGSFVTFHSIGNVNREGYDLEHHALAMMDIWILSFCDVIQTSEVSTFGELSAALAGVRPFVMNIVERPRSSWLPKNRGCMLPANKTSINPNGFDWRENNLPLCAQAVSIDPCAEAPLMRKCAPTGHDCLAGQPDYIQACKTGSPFYWQIIDRTNKNG